MQEQVIGETVLQQLLLRFSSVVWTGTIFDNHANKNQKKNDRLVL